MITEDLVRLLHQYRNGEASEREVLDKISLPTEISLGFANVDTNRGLRKGFPEVIFAAGKTPDQVVKIAATILETDHVLLITRVGDDHAGLLQTSFPDCRYHPQSRTVVVERKALKKKPGNIAVVSAGTSDAGVADEAAITAEVMGNHVVRISDVGVAGIHRLLKRVSQLQEANVIIVVAGMEGALPSVVAGLVSRPVIAVPTSVGYGANFGGLAALLGMLNSCGSGVTVVNIDNGFGAGYAAAQINAMAASQVSPTT